MSEQLSEQSIDAAAYREGSSPAESEQVSLDEWIARAAIPFSVDAPASFTAAVDTVIAGLGDGVEVLGCGEALHGSQDILVLRNRLFERLVEAHGYSAIAIE